MMKIAAAVLLFTFFAVPPAALGISSMPTTGSDPGIAAGTAASTTTGSDTGATEPAASTTTGSDTSAGPAAETAPAPSQQDLNNCASWPDVPVNITPVFDEPKIDLSQDRTSIRSMAGDREHSIPQYIGASLGATIYEPVLDFDVPIKTEDLPDGLTCAYVQHVNARIGYRDVTLSIDNDFPQDSCDFNEIMAHEQKHIAASRQLLDEFLPLMEQRFKSWLKLNGALREENADYARQVINSGLKSIAEEMIDRMNTVNLQRQKAVDNQQEYMHLINACGGDLYRAAPDGFRLTGQ